MTQYFLTYNPEKHQYIVWDNKGVAKRVLDTNKSMENRLEVVKFLQEEHEKAKQPLQIYKMGSGEDLEAIMKAVDGIRKK